MNYVFWGYAGAATGFWIWGMQPRVAVLGQHFFKGEKCFSSNSNFPGLNRTNAIKFSNTIRQSMLKDENDQFYFKAVKLEGRLEKWTNLSFAMDTKPYLILEYKLEGNPSDIKFAEEAVDLLLAVNCIEKSKTPEEFNRCHQFEKAALQTKKAIELTLLQNKESEVIIRESKEAQRT